MTLKLLSGIAMLFLAFVKGQITLVNPQPDISFTAQTIPPATFASQDNIFPIDLNNNGQAEHYFRWDAYGSNEWYIHFRSVYNFFAGVTAQVIMEGTLVKPLNFGDAINPSAVFAVATDPFISNYTTPNFQNLGNRYIGFKTTVSGTVYYGWVLVEQVNRTLTIKEYAFTTSASGLTAGQGGTLSVTESMNAGKGATAAISPNPSGAFIIIDDKDHTGSSLNITVHDLSGKVMMKQEAEFGKPIDTRSLQSGTYMLRIEYEGITTVKKMIKK